MHFYTTLYIIVASNSEKSEEAPSCDETFLSVKSIPSTQNDENKTINKAEVQNFDEIACETTTETNRGVVENFDKSSNGSLNELIENGVTLG